MHHSRTITVAIVSVIFLVASIALCVFLLFTIAEKKIELHDLGLSKAKALLDARSLTTLSTALADTKTEREFIMSRVLKEEDVVDLLTLIETLSKEQGVVLTTQSLRVEPINSSFEALVVGVSVEGQYAALMHLLTLFEHLPYQVSVEKVVFERSQTESSMSWRSMYDIVITKTTKKP